MNQDKAYNDYIAKIETRIRENIITERPTYTHVRQPAPMPSGYSPDGEYVVSWDRLAGPHSRWLNISVPFQTAQAAYDYIESADAEEKSDATVIKLSDLYANCNAGTCGVCGND